MPFDKKRKKEIAEATKAALAAEIRWREETAARLEQEADFHEMAGDLKQAEFLRATAAQGREKVIQIRRIAEEGR